MTAADSGTILAIPYLDSAGPVMVWIIVLSFVFMECGFIVGLFLPGDSLLFTAGVVLAREHHEVNAWLLSGAAVVVAVAGNLLGYYIGRRTGSSLVGRKGGKVLTNDHLERARAFLDRRGFMAIVLARWIPWIRTLAPLIAGAAGMNPRRYLLATTMGALAWVPTLVLLGYYGSGLFEDIPWLQAAILWISVGCFLAGTVWGLWRYRQEMRRPADRAEAHAAD